MSQIEKRNPNTIAPGSLSDIARKSGLTLAEAFMSLDAAVIVDTSGSMAGQPYQDACSQLARLQAETPGKIAVIAFSAGAEFCPSGYPRFIGQGTDMRAALEFVKVADGTGIKLILISDGEPNDEAGTLAVARTFTSKIDTIYVGREGDAGAEFLRRLSEATGGISTTTQASELGRLAGTVRLMIGG